MNKWSGVKKSEGELLLSSHKVRLSTVMAETITEVDNNQGRSNQLVFLDFNSML